MTIHLLALSGSLRAVSSNTAVLNAASMLAPEGVAVELYRDSGRLPHFNPDLERELPELVVELRSRVEAADGLLISCPEYARGIPGSFKNMLDWLVGSLHFAGKPVALFNTSQRSSDAQAALRLVLTTMAARLVDEASISVRPPGAGASAESIAADPEAAGAIVQALRKFGAAIEHGPS